MGLLKIVGYILIGIAVIVNAIMFTLMGIKRDIKGWVETKEDEDI